LNQCFGLIVCLVLLGSGCSDEGRNMPSAPFDLPGSADADALSGQDGAGDQAVPDAGDSVAQPEDLPDKPDLPVESDLPDIAAPDTGGDLPVEEMADDGSDGDPDTGPEEFEPFAGCSKTEPCPYPQEPLCLMLPGEFDVGICVKQCGPGGELCPPWHECIQPDPEMEDLKVCMKVAGLNEECSHVDGTICGDGLFCLLGLEEESPLCTSFCTMGEAICQQGTECKVTDPDDPDADWGACLPMDDLAPCEAPGECDESEACVAVVAGYYKCAPACNQVGAPCGIYGTCVALEQPDGESAGVCLSFQGQGVVCNPQKGLPCEEGLICADLSAGDGWNRCLKPCEWGPCALGYVCKQVGLDAAELCVPLEYALEESTPCNDAYPCKEAGFACVKPAGDGNGVCAQACETGCPEGTSCFEGGCLVVSPPGGSCLETVGVVCEKPSKCIRDKKAVGPGWCGLPCTPGQTQCPDDTKCTPTALGQNYCLETAGYMELCSLDDGIGCEAAKGLTCIHFTSETDFGFCTTECSGPGTCTAEIEGGFSECMVQVSGTWYCALLCGGLGDCPDWMECSGIGMCVP